VETLLVRLKPYDPRRGNLLRHYTYAGIKFQEERGWYRVDKSVAEYLRRVHQQPSDPHSALAFDVCTDAEAKTLEATETEDAKVRRSATDELKVVPARGSGAVTTESLPKPTGADDKDRRGRPNRE
jgi:hypothetical protein